MRSMSRFVMLVLWVVCCSQAFARDEVPVRIATLECAFSASAKHGIPTNVLLAVLSIESGTEGRTSKNANGTLDYGRAQINDVSVKELIPSTHDAQQVKLALKNDGCYSVEAAAFLIAKRVSEPPFNQNFWTRVARYHSRTPPQNEKYRRLLIPLADRWGVWLQTHYQAVAYQTQ